MGARVSPRDHHRNTQPAARFRNASSFFSNPPHAASHTQHAARFIYASSFLATRLMPQATRTQATRTVSPRDHHRNVPRAREPARRSPHPKNITRFVPPSLAGASSGHKYAIFWWFGFTSLVTHGGSSGAHAPSSIKKMSMKATVQHLGQKPCTQRRNNRQSPATLPPLSQPASSRGGAWPGRSVAASAKRSTIKIRIDRTPDRQSHATPRPLSQPASLRCWRAAYVINTATIHA